MAHIFISHASEDKPRLAPFLDRLLVELPDHVSLWIDRPADPNLVRGQVFSFEHRRVRDMGIRVGEEWDESIETAISESIGVIAFWSTAAAASGKTVLRQEITTAREQGKLVPVALDQGAIDAFWFKNQLELVAGEDGPVKFARAIDSLKRLLNGELIDVGAGTSRDSVDRLPYRVDRSHHVQEICTWASLRPTEPAGAGAQQQVRRAVFVVPCTEQDALDQLVTRIVEKDGPAYCRLDAETTPPIWRHHHIDWSLMHTKDVATGIADALQSPDARIQIQTALAHDVPVLMWAQLDASRIAGRHADVIAQWAKAWSELPVDKLHLRQAQARQQGRALTIVALVFVLGKPCRRFLFWKATTPDLDKVCARVSRLLGASYPAPRRLEPITPRHATSWLATAELTTIARLKRISIEDLRDEIAEIFSKAGEMPMQRFVEGLKSTKTWQTARGKRRPRNEKVVGGS